MAQAFPFAPTEDPQAVPLDYTNMLPAPPAVATAPQQGYATMAQPQDVQQLYKPTNDPQEIQARTEGWQQVLQRVTSDPNLMRAIGYAGATLSQPMQRGQTLAGHMGQAFMVGSSAYNFGKDAEFQRQLAMRKEGREQAESEATVGLRKAQTTSSEVSTEGQRTANEIATATKQSTIDKAKAEVDLTNQKLANAKSEAEKLKIELDAQKRREQIIAEAPGAEKAAVLAELQRPGAELKRIAAQTSQANAAAGASTASARASNAKAQQDELENEALGAIKDPKERLAAQRSLRTGAAGTSAQVQMADWYKSNLKIGNPNMSDQEASQKAVEWLSSKKVDNYDQYLKWRETYNQPKGETEEQTVEKFKQQKALFEGGGASTMQPAVPGPGSGRGTPTATAKPPTIGEIRKGYKFKGGNPADPKNWEKVK